jgi:hypothetical protein
MSSSEDEDVRRPGRNARGRLSDDEGNASEMDQNNDADDKDDLFGSDSEEGLNEYVAYLNPL